MRANVEKLIRLQNHDLIDKNGMIFPPPAPSLGGQILYEASITACKPSLFFTGKVLEYFFKALFFFAKG